MSRENMTVDEVLPTHESNDNKTVENKTATPEDIDEEEDYERYLEIDEVSGMGSDVDKNFDNNLPKTVTLLRGQDGSKLYLVGTAHFSLESQDDVSKVIKAVRPHIVVVELCKSRASILQMDEETIEREAKNLSFEKMRMTIRENGVLQGLMYMLLLHLSAQLTKDLGMAPGGEFRRAFSEVKKMPGCILHFGDRPIQVTLKRALSDLSWWQCIRMAYSLIFKQGSISKEDVEKCKESDLLEMMLKEMMFDFPELSKVFVEERDVYLTHSLQLATSCCFIDEQGETKPTVAVGVVGIGHTPGIKKMWGKVKDTDIPPIMVIKEQTQVSKMLKRSLAIGFLILAGWQVVRFTRNSQIFTLRIKPLLSSFNY